MKKIGLYTFLGGFLVFLLLILAQESVKWEQEKAQKEKARQGVERLEQLLDTLNK